jgi:hypothetical protein
MPIIGRDLRWSRRAGQESHVFFFFFGLRSFFPAGGFSKDEKVHANAMVPRGGE